MGDVLVETQPPIGWIRLARPEAMNALDDVMLDRIESALDSLERDDSVRVIALTGSGRSFCCGADLKAVGASVSIDPASLSEFLARASAVVERLATFAKPVIAAVNGLAIAGGLELVLACDLAIAAASARLGDGHANFGVLPGAGGTVRLARIAGPRMAKHLALTGAVMPAGDLLGCGLINEVVPDAALEERVAAVARSIAEKSPLVLSRFKHLIDESLDQPLSASLVAERDVLAIHVLSDDMREGLAAFREKRDPQYSGR
jgi:enoyl-CoA hydratase/carnithine racemase